jgi:dTDP-4-dehydrorhamnose reductase
LRTLILGGTGTIGSALTAACDDRRLPHLTTSYRGNGNDHSPLDVRDGDAVRELVADYAPDVTVFAAPVDADAAGIANVAAAVRDIGGVLAVFSCDGVFGECRHAMREDDALTPAGDRAERHAAGERAVRDLLPDRHLVIRTGAVYDARPAGTVARLVKKLRRGEAVRADHDKLTYPTFAADLADVTLDLLKHGHLGTFHAVGSERHTEFTFARLVAHLFGHDADLVTPGASDCDRPTKVALDRLRLRALLGPNALRTPAEGLRAVRAQLAPRRLAAAA